MPRPTRGESPRCCKRWAACAPRTSRCSAGRTPARCGARSSPSTIACAPPARRPCSSSTTRPMPPFDIRLSERVAGEGAVFLTSSSASEDSQESDDIKGSFFTHALVSGLLGAADENGDGRVTLDEAYRYAYEATLRASSRAWAGVQHPTFEYEVRGMGDVVLAALEANAPTRA